MAQPRAVTDRLKAIAVAVEIADRGSLTAAADALDISRAMASRALAALEAWLGARLFHRTTRQLRLTQAGTEALSRFRAILTIEDELRATLDKHRTAAGGHIRVTCSPSFAHSFLAGAVVEFVAQHRGVIVDLMVSDQALDLVEHRIDLAIRISNTLDSALIARRLSVCRSVLCATPAYLASRGTPTHPSDLAAHECLTHQFVGQNSWTLGAGDGAVTVPVSGAICSNEAAALLTAVQGDAGIGLLPTYLVAPLLRSGALVEVLPDFPPAAMGINGVYTSRQQMPAAVRAFIDFLADRLAGEPPWDL